MSSVSVMFGGRLPRLLKVLVRKGRGDVSCFPGCSTGRFRNSVLTVSVQHLFKKNCNTPGCQSDSKEKQHLPFA